MDHHEDEPTFQGQLFQQVHDVLAIARAEAAGGLIHEEHARLADQFQCDVQPFPLAATDGLLQRAAHFKVLGLVQAQRLQHAQYTLAHLLVVLVAEAELGVVEQVLVDG